MTTPATTADAAPAPAPARAPSALELTLDPVDGERFLDEHVDRAPLLVARDEPGRFDAILSDADVERPVCAKAIRMPALRPVRDGARLPAAG